MKIICLTKNFKGQTPSGGYDQLSKVLGAETVQRPVINSLPLRSLEKAWSFCWGAKPHLFSHLSHGYRFEDRLCEEQAFWRAMLGRADIIHALYGDWMLDTLLRRKYLLSSGIVATFHLPAEFVTDRFEKIQRRDLGQLDGAVVLSSHELRAFSQWLGQRKVMFIPHGIDIHTFRPASFTLTGVARFVFVGMMLRDFEIAHRVIDRCRQESVKAEFFVVIPPEGRSFFTGCTNAKLLSRISEEELISIYQHCDALFLPLLHSTANNAILEALACGLPVISTRVGGVPDYVNDKCGWLLPISDFDAAYECVRDIIQERENAFHKRAAARAKAETFAWERIRPELSDAYSRVKGSRGFAPG